jgi:hypothetical protein
MNEETEYIDKKPNLEKAILLCYHKLSEESFKFSDFKFLLLKKERENKRKKPLTKEQKQLYQKWEMELKNFRYEWKNPFKSYRCTTAFLSKTLSKLVSLGILEKHNNNYSVPAEEYYNLAKTNLMFNISVFPKKSITRIYEDKVNLYGIIPGRVNKNDTFENDVKVFWSKVNELENVFKKVENVIMDINRIQLEIMAKVAIREIKTGPFPKKDVKLALKYLKKRMTEPDKKKLTYNWIVDDGNEILVYSPKNYFLDTNLCILVKNFLNIFVDYFLPKPVVYTYESKEKDFPQFENVYQKIKKMI